MLSCINTAGWLIAVLKLGTCFFNISLYTVAFILPLSLTRGPVQATNMMPNTITLPPPNLKLLLVHWGVYGSLGLRRTNLLPSQANRSNFDSSLKWIWSHCSSIYMTCSGANFNRFFSFFLEMKGFVEVNRLIKFISLSLQEIVCLNVLMPKLALALLEKVVAVESRSFFDSLPIHLSSLAVVFLGLPGGFLASHDQVSWIFLRILWITLLDFPTVFEISPHRGFIFVT